MTRRIAVVGVGGMGREVLDVIEAIVALGGGVAAAGVIDDAPSDLNLERLAARGYEYLGDSDTALAEGAFDEYVIGIGTPSVRRKVAERYGSAGAEAAVLVHPAASVGALVEMLPGVIVCAGARLTTNIVLERHVLLNNNTTVGHDTRLGAYTVANPGASISGDVSVGEGVLIGTSAAILQGLNIGIDATVGGSACVTKDVAAGMTVVGVPARELGSTRETGRN